MKLIISVYGFIAMSFLSACSSAPVSVGKGYEAMASNEANTIMKTAQYEQNLKKRGPGIYRGYSNLREGMSEDEVSRNFEYINYTSSQKICGEGSSGPIVCRVRTYDGMIDNQKINVVVIFRKNTSSDWVVIAWE